MSSRDCYKRKRYKGSYKTKNKPKGVQIHLN